MGRVSHQGVPLEMIDVSAETAVLEARRDCTPWLRRSAMVAGLLICIGFWVVGSISEGLSVFRLVQAQSLSQYYHWGHGSLGPTGQAGILFAWQARVAPDLPVTGNHHLYPDVEDEAVALRKRHPEDLSILLESLCRRSTEHDEFMSPDERELIARLDPDNALWGWIESRWLRDKAYGRNPAERNFYVSSSSGVTVDEGLVKRSWELFHGAASKPFYRDYSPQLFRRQLEAFPMDGTFMRQAQVHGFLDLLYSAGDFRSHYYYSGDGDIQLAVAEFVSAKDLAGLRKLAEAWKKLTIMRIRSEPFVPREGVDRCRQQAGNLAQGFGRLDDRDSEKAFDQLSNNLGTIDVRSYLPSTDPLDDLMPIRGQMGSVIPHEVDPAELIPARRGERAFFDRIVSWLILMAVLFVTLCCGVEAYRRHVSVKGMARGIAPLFGLKDHLWVGGVGIIVPGIYWWAVTRLTPWGFRDVGMGDEWQALGWFLQAILSGVFMIVALVQAVHWRWGIRGAFLGFRSRVDWLGWAVLGVLALAVPAVSIVMHVTGGGEEKGLFLLSMAGAGLVGVLWLLWVGGMNLFTSRHGSLGPNVISRSLLPWAMALAWMVLLSAGILLFAEKSWAKKDKLFPFWTSETYANAFEERAVLEVRDAMVKFFDEL